MPHSPEPWREAFKKHKFRPEGALEYADEYNFAAGWQALASLPELREVAEAAKSAAELIVASQPSILSEKWGQGRNLLTALAAFKARMGMP